jgi:hypothetical protein
MRPLWRNTQYKGLLYTRHRKNLKYHLVISFGGKHEDGSAAKEIGGHDIPLGDHLVDIFIREKIP